MIHGLPPDGVKPSKPSPTSPPGGSRARSGRNYRLSEPEVDAVHLHQREGLQRGLLPDFSLHAVADVPGPDHLEAQGLAPRRWDEGAPQVDALAHELWGDHGPEGEGRDGCWRQGEDNQVMTFLCCFFGLLVKKFEVIVFGELSLTIYFLTLLETKQTLEMKFVSVLL